MQKKSYQQLEQDVARLNVVHRFSQQFFGAIREAEKPRVCANDKERLAAIRQGSKYREAFTLEAPLVSVIIPTLNRARTIIDRTLPSLHAQTYKNWNVYIIGDGMTAEDAQPLEEIDDPRVVFVNLKRRGKYPKARGPLWYTAGIKPINFGLRIASGHWITHLDDDDEFTPDHISLLLDLARARNAEWTHGKVQFIEDDGSKGLLVGQPVPILGGIARISSLYHAGLKTFRYNANCWRYCYPGDWDLWERFLDMGVRHAHTPRIVGVHHGTASRLEELVGGRGGASANTIGAPTRLPRDAQEREELDRQNAYATWLCDRTLTDARRGWINDEIATWEKPIPRVHLVLFALPGQQDLLANTLHGLQSQLYTEWFISLVSFEPIALPSALASLVERGKVQTYVLGDDEDSLEVTSRLLASSDAGWVGQIWPGDRLAPEALFRMLVEANLSSETKLIYCDEDTITAELRRRHLPKMKPDSNPDLLLSYNYIGQFFLTSRDAFDNLGGYRQAHEGAEEYGLLLGLLDRHGPAAFAHAAEVLYHRHETGRQTHLNPESYWNLVCQIVSEHVTRRYPYAEVARGQEVPLTRIRYPLTATPRVSIIVPTRDHPEDLRSCLDSVSGRNAYPNVELILVNHETSDREALELIAVAESRGAMILPYAGPFNFSDMMNRAVEIASGEFILLLNNDVIAHDEHWLEDLVRHGLRDEIGVVGPKLLYADGTVQHAGVILGIGNRPAEHPFSRLPSNEAGYMLRALATQNFSAVTGACLLIRRDLYLSVGGLDADTFKTWYQDIDLCLKVRQRGKQVLLAADLVMTHQHASTFRDPAPTVNREHDGEAQDIALCRRWAGEVGNDPAYNKNLHIGVSPFTLEPNPLVSPDQRWKPRPRVLAFPIDNHGSGEYRIKAPSRRLASAGLIEGGWSEVILGPSDVLRSQADSFVFQRHDTERHHDFIERCRSYSSAFRVLEIDDFLHGINDNRRDHRKLELGHVASGFEKAATLCDRLVVSTGALAEEYQHLNSDIKVVPNFMEYEKWRVLTPRRRQGAKPRVGWAGGSSHFGDLMLLEDVVKILAAEVDWVFLGICPEPLRAWVKEFHLGVSIDAYPMKLASLDLDLALAPLEQCRFNECKSPLRLLECGILGYPVVCTDIVTFEGDFPVTRVRNSTDDWVSAIRAQIDNRDALAVAGDHMRQHIHEHWLLENNLDRWLSAWLPG